MSILLQIGVNAILAAAIYALVAGGLSFLYATTKIFHLAHGIVVLGAGYAFWWAWIAQGWHPLLAGVFAVLATALTGVLMNELVYETLRRRGTRGLGYLIATLALLMFGTALVLLLFGAAPKTFRLQTASLEFADVFITALQLWMIGVATALLIFFAWIVKFTKFGKAMRATADNEEVARVLGIRTKDVRRLAFALSSVLAAAAGILIGLEFNLDPNMGIFYAIRGFAAVVIGTAGSLPGAVIASLLIGLVEQLGVWFLGSSWRASVVFVLLFFFLLFKPAGLFGRRREA